MVWSLDDPSQKRYGKWELLAHCKYRTSAWPKSPVECGKQTPQPDIDNFPHWIYLQQNNKHDDFRRQTVAQEAVEQDCAERPQQAANVGLHFLHCFVQNGKNDQIAEA